MNADVALSIKLHPQKHAHRTQDTTTHRVCRPGVFFQSFARPNLRQWPARVSQGETPVPERSSWNGGSFQGPAASVGAPLGSFLNGIAPPSRGLRDRAVGGRCSGSGLLPLSVSGFEHQQEVAGAGRTDAQLPHQPLRVPGGSHGRASKA